MTSDNINNELLQRQLINLGDMIGDGLHYESPWISKEYRRISKLLNPEIYELQRKAKADNILTQMQALMATKKCSCGGALRQRRKGTKVCYCIMCNKRFKATTKKISQ